MRGVPNNPVTCTECGSETGCPKDRLCSKCRSRALGEATRRFIWTEALDQMLRLGYQRARRHREKTAAIDNVVRASGFPRHIVKMRAAELGITHDIRRPWTDQERAYLRASAGLVTPKSMARKLRRSHESVESMLDKLHLTRRLMAGYTIEDVAALLGVSRRTVDGWMAKQWLRWRRGRIREQEMLTFLRLHADQYDLRRVDQAWFKGMVFPTFGTLEQTNKALGVA